MADLDAPVVGDADLHHFRRVRRLDDGTPITIADGAGRWRSARFGDEPVVDGPVEEEPPPTTRITVGFAPVKGERPEWVVQKLTELGVDTIVPLQTARSVVRWDGARAAKQHAKWETVAREAAMQSRRLHLPVVQPVTALSDLFAQSDGAVLAEPGAPALGPGDRTVLIGPEGGWDPSELEGRRSCGLPGGVLRAETAAITAAVLLVAARAG